ncbi:MFS transporter [Ruania albidiflava]|uniref:MFS transporter n=1 Tax=Ruania albidiflava TaxID=366586 RepID=UPI0003B5DEE4|nr:MFS transporter [Ruania albidiflava]
MTSAPARLPRWLLLVGIVVVAINLRPAIAAVGPVLPVLGADVGVGSVALGLLGALPVAVFGVASSVVHRLLHTFGVERTTAGALGLLTIATLLRSWPGPEANLWVGTVLVGAAIAVGNVTVPVLVRQDFPGAAARVTGIYVAVLGFFAGLSAAVAVPLANLSTLGWRLALGVWAVLTLLGLLVWWPRAHRTSRPDPARTDAPAGGPLWRTAAAWQISVYMGLQSSSFYVALTWLPTVEQDLGFLPEVAGWHMFLLQIVSMVGNLGAPVLMRRSRDERFPATLAGLCVLSGTVGFLLLPGAAVAWIVLLGLGMGVAFVVSLTLIAVRAGDLRTAPRLSAMAQSVGYLIAAVALLVAGVLHGVAGGPAVLGVIVAVSTGTAALGLLVGRSAAITA